jgi:acetoin utilization protein AcuB
VITIGPDEPIEQAALLMEMHRISGLVVIDGGAVIGMLTITDLLRAFVTFLGLREGGRRLTIDIPDTPGELASVAKAAPPANIVAVVSAGPTDGALRRLVVRVKGEGADTFADRLRAQGVIVRDVR